MIHRPLRLALVAFLTLAFAALAKEAAVKTAKPLHISKGEKVELTDYMVPGKTTVFDFYSDYCPPCVRIAPEVEKVHRTRDNIVVVKVDINRPGVKEIDWKSPVAQQFRLRSIPHFKVYGPDGKLVAEDGPNDAKARNLVVSWFK